MRTVTHVAVTAIGADRPGIVAALTEALFRAGANLEDVTSTILRGHFAMMLVVDTPEPAERLRDRLAEAMDPVGVTVSVRDVEATEGEPAGPTHSVSVYGADRPGIVAGVARALADAGVNIADLSCRLVGAEGHEVYAMLAEVSVPPTTDPDRVARSLQTLAAELEVDLTFASIEPEVL
jgi:glycine cleavage system transcriptional repressor